MEMAAQLGIPCEERDLDVYDAVTADEVFLTSTSLCLCGVRSVNGQPIGDGRVPGPITKRLTDAYVALRRHRLRGPVPVPARLTSRDRSLRSHRSVRGGRDRHALRAAGGRGAAGPDLSPAGPADRPLGAVVYVHGGAWARLDRTADAIMCGALAASGRGRRRARFPPGPGPSVSGGERRRRGRRPLRPRARGPAGRGPGAHRAPRQLERRAPGPAPRGADRPRPSRGHADRAAGRLARSGRGRRVGGLRGGPLSGRGSAGPLSLRAVPRARAAAAVGLRRQAADRLASRVLRGRGRDGGRERHADRLRRPGHRAAARSGSPSRTRTTTCPPPSPRPS